MGGKTAAQRRAISGEFVNLYEKGTLVGARVLRRVPLAQALEKETQRRWRRVAFDNGELAGFQPYAERSAARSRTSGSAGTLEDSQSMISSAEAQMNAGVYGASRTCGMPEWKKERRQRVAKEKYHRIVEPEDAIERAVEKVRIWPELRGVEPGLKPVVVDA
jgi:hypothetical protein